MAVRYILRDAYELHSICHTLTALLEQRIEVMQEHKYEVIYWQGWSLSTAQYAKRRLVEAQRIVMLTPVSKSKDEQDPMRIVTASAPGHS